MKRYEDMTTRYIERVEPIEQTIADFLREYGDNPKTNNQKQNRKDKQK